MSFLVFPTVGVMLVFLNVCVMLVFLNVSVSQCQCGLCFLMLVLPNHVCVPPNPGNISKPTVTPNKLANQPLHY